MPIADPRLAHGAVRRLRGRDRTRRNGGSGLAIAFTTNFRIALGFRALQGVGFAGVTPVIITCLGDLYEGDAEATAQGIRFGISGVSPSVPPVECI